MRTLMGLLVIATALIGSSSRPPAHELINRETVAVSETANVGDQEQLRRYFLMQGWR